MQKYQSIALHSYVIKLSVVPMYAGCSLRMMGHQYDDKLDSASAVKNGAKAYIEKP
jgi:hypothetical protein